ncbi:MAG: amidohydrolase family protein [Burkholderiaceae bacterium]
MPTSARDQRIALATHDDTSIEQVDEAVSRARRSATPTTEAAARHAKAHGMATVAGAPNVVRGGSHSGNVSATELARQGLLDVLSSDYVPASLINAAWLLHRQAGFSLPAAIASVSLRPARATGLTDRGEIAAGQRADLARIHPVANQPAVREVWVAGKRVH